MISPNDKLALHCPACDVPVGYHHVSGCDIEQCPYCGSQLFSCDCENHPPLAERMPWTGLWPGVVECREIGWYAKPVPGGWVPCEKDDPGAIEDLNRLHAEARWDRLEKRFVFDGVVPSPKSGANDDAIDCINIQILVNYSRFKLKFYFEGIDELHDFNLYLDGSLEAAKAAVLDEIKVLQDCGWAFEDERIRGVMTELDSLWTKNRKFRRRLKQYLEECQGS